MYKMYKAKFNRSSLKIYKLIKNYKIEIICFFILLVFYVVLNLFIQQRIIAEQEELKSLILENYSVEIRKLLLSDFKIFLGDEYNPNDLSIITNINQEPCNTKASSRKHITFSNGILNIRDKNICTIIDVTNISTSLNNLANNFFFYEINLDNERFLTNYVYDLQDSKNLNTHSERIGKDLVFTINVQHMSESPYIIYSNKKLRSNIILFFGISAVFIFVIIFPIIVLYLRKKRELNLERKYKDDILNFNHQNNEFIFYCYEYSKQFQKYKPSDLENQKFSDYLPLSIASEGEVHKKIELEVAPFIRSIQSYFLSYMNSHKIVNIEFNVSYKEVENIVMPFDQEVLYQLLISIVYNLMIFNQKSRDKRKIEIKFKKTQITILSDGLKLNKEYAIKASEMIFYNTANPYLLGFGQIFVLLGKYNLDFDTYHSSDGTVLIINLLDLRKKEIDKNDKSVIDLNQYKRTKK